MKAMVDGGLAHLELTATEVRTLFASVHREAEYHLEIADRSEAEADAADRFAANNRKGRVTARRLAGQLRQQAAAHRAFYRDACDLRRVLAQLATNPAAR